MPFDMTTLSDLNDPDNGCPISLLWSPAVIHSQRPTLYVCIIASIFHSFFWLQLVFCPAVRKKSMQWLYAYLATDILLLFRFFFIYIVHTTSHQCNPTSSWRLFVCYFEAIFDNYLNTLEVYILLALNICRHVHIVHNKDAYKTYVRTLICAHLLIYLVPLIMYIIQLSVGWAQIRTYPGGSCDILYCNVIAQVLNIIFGILLPIILNIVVIYLNMRHIRLTSKLNRGRHHVSAREKYHRSIVIQFFIFYIVWLSLWSPNLIVYQFTSGISPLTTITSLLNFIEIALDPIIIAALDVRFQKLWKNLWIYVGNLFISNPINQRRIVPITTNRNAWSTGRAPMSVVNYPA